MPWNQKHQGRVCFTAGREDKIKRVMCLVQFCACIVKYWAYLKVGISVLIKTRSGASLLRCDNSLCKKKKKKIPKNIDVSISFNFSNILKFLTRLLIWPSNFLLEVSYEIVLYEQFKICNHCWIERVAFHYAVNLPPFSFLFFDEFGSFFLF